MEEHPVQIPKLNLTRTDPAIPGWHRETSFLRSYPPDSDPVILVIGVYNGVIAQLLVDQMPDARFYLFEPQDWAAEQLKERFGHLPNVEIRNFALGDRSGAFQMAFYGQDTCSFMRGSTPLNPGHEAFFDGRMEEFTEVMDREGIESAYYAFINVEYYEHVLLPHLERTGWLEKFETIGMSWHPDAGPVTWQGESTVPRGDLLEILAKNHDLVLEIDNWQSWVRNGVRTLKAAPVEATAESEGGAGSEESEEAAEPGETTESEEETARSVCPHPDCGWEVPEGKDSVMSLAAHSRSHKKR